MESFSLVVMQVEIPYLVGRKKYCVSQQRLLRALERAEKAGSWKLEAGSAHPELDKAYVPFSALLVLM